MGEAWLIPAIPAAAFVILLLVGKYLPRRGDWLAIGAIAASFVLFFFVLADLLDNMVGTEFDKALGQSGIDWVSFSDFELRLGFQVDQLAIVMLAVVTFITLMVLVYSTGYMKDDPRYGWYFAAISMFAAAMLALVLADNFLLLYAAWEGVGFGSYLLIGFWHEKRSAAEAAKKAFITTRIGDVGLLIGIILLWREAGTFDMSEIFEFAESGGYSTEYLTMAVLFLFAGAVGKSAQFPLHVWLPDAMEGPTPVSALIHAATMVVAGVYLICLENDAGAVPSAPWRFRSEYPREHIPGEVEIFELLHIDGQADAMGDTLLDYIFEWSFNSVEAAGRIGGIEVLR
ncbi:MAG: hypothetical protein IH920_02005 [Chloroflexi bacterium]|nr:hypothetical protein [Chloroflexota bacterium]